MDNKYLLQLINQFLEDMNILQKEAINICYSGLKRNKMLEKNNANLKELFPNSNPDPNRFLFKNDEDFIFYLEKINETLRELACKIGADILATHLFDSKKPS